VNEETGTVIRIALAQLNPHVGALEHNLRLVRDGWEHARDAGADLVAFPEMVLTGYPPEDLLMKPEFIDANLEAVRKLATELVDGPAAIVGFVDQATTPPDRDDWDVAVVTRTDLRNAAAFLTGGEIAAVYHKRRLPTYGVFDEARWFSAGDRPAVVTVADVPVAMTICEDLWTDAGPVAESVESGARIVVNINASPYHRGKPEQRDERVAGHARSLGVPIVYVNTVGAQDGVVFDGGSMVAGEDGRVTARAAQFRNDILVVDVGVEAGPFDRAPAHPRHDRPRPKIDREDEPRLDEVGQVWEAVVLGLRDYCRKNGFERVTLGLSGGIDSTVTAAVAADALGPENVLGVSMPSRFTSDESFRDIDASVEGLGIEGTEIAIDPLMEGYDDALADLFEGHDHDETEENIQARIRGVLLMAISNKLGHLVIATGNKSEAAVGYTTLYGDTVGGFAPLIDCTKQMVYALAEHRNARDDDEVIPEAIISKAPTAELAPDQTDEDSLPPYSVLDPIIELYLEQDRGIQAIVDEGYDEETVREIVRLIDNAEFKRQQAPPGVKVTERSFNHDRHVPITNGWRV
jgi:NAD+ synthase (glutamine-hydrolysing)